MNIKTIGTNSRRRWTAQWSRLNVWTPDRPISLWSSPPPFPVSHPHSASQRELFQGACMQPWSGCTANHDVYQGHLALYKIRCKQANCFLLYYNYLGRHTRKWQHSKYSPLSQDKYFLHHKNVGKTRLWRRRVSALKDCSGLHNGSYYGLGLVMLRGRMSQCSICKLHFPEATLSRRPNNYN